MWWSRARALGAGNWLARLSEQLAGQKFRRQEAEKLDALILALRLRVLVGPLPRLVVTDGAATVRGRGWQATGTHPARHSQVQRSRAFQPAQEHVGCASQPPASVGRGGRRPGFSSSGLRPAASQRSARRLRSRLCLLTRSPLQVHALAWSPKRSASPSHMVQ